MKVIHIVENLDRGAVEGWLVRMLRHARARGARLDWTFYCALGRPGAMDAEARELGARIVYSPEPIGRTTAFALALRREVDRGRYDVLHAHHDLVSGVYLLAALGLPIATRIVHVHNADENVLTPSPMKQRVYRPLLRATCLALADRIVGISQHTLRTFLAGAVARASDCVHLYGIDAPPHASGARGELRSSLALAPGTPILLFAGRVVPEKNPLFVIDVLAALRRVEPRAVAVFAGAGALEAAVLDRARALGVDDAVHALGWRRDVRALMAQSEVFVLPHVEHAVEGFGMAIVEAQLAGQRLLLSDGVADDPLLPTAVYRRLPLAAGPEAWADAARVLLETPTTDAEEVRAAFDASPMSLNRALDALLAIHRGEGPAQ